MPLKQTKKPSTRKTSPQDRAISERLISKNLSSMEDDFETDIEKQLTRIGLSLQTTKPDKELEKAMRLGYKHMSADEKKKLKTNLSELGYSLNRSLKKLEMVLKSADSSVRVGIAKSLDVKADNILNRAEERHERRVATLVKQKQVEVEKTQKEIENVLDDLREILNDTLSVYSNTFSNSMSRVSNIMTGNREELVRNITSNASDYTRNQPMGQIMPNLINRVLEFEDGKFRPKPHPLPEQPKVSDGGKKFLSDLGEHLESNGYKVKMDKKNGYIKFNDSKTLIQNAVKQYLKKELKQTSTYRNHKSTSIEYLRKDDINSIRAYNHNAYLPLLQKDEVTYDKAINKLAEEIADKSLKTRDGKLVYDITAVEEFMERSRSAHDRMTKAVNNGLKTDRFVIALDPDYIDSSLKSILDEGHEVSHEKTEKKIFAAIKKGALRKVDCVTSIEKADKFRNQWREKYIIAIIPQAIMDYDEADFSWDNYKLLLNAIRKDAEYVTRSFNSLSDEMQTHADIMRVLRVVNPTKADMIEDLLKERL